MPLPRSHLLFPVRKVFSGMVQTPNTEIVMTAGVLIVVWGQAIENGISSQDIDCWCCYNPDCSVSPSCCA